MTIKVWGPLFILLLAGVGIAGLVAEYPKPHNRGQPTEAPCRNRPECKRITAVTSNEDNDKGKQESNWYDKPTDWLLALFTGILALYTRRLYQATAGLLKETAGLRNAADQQSRDMKASIAVSNAVAKAAQKSADVAEKSLLAANLPFITISPLELCDANEFKAEPHIHFGFKNSGKGVAIVNQITATVQTTPRGGRALTLATNSGFVNDAIEPGQTTSGNRMTSGVLGVRELQQIKSGEMTLGIIFQIISQDIFHNSYPQTWSVVFDPKQGGFMPSRLIPEKEQKST